jgi:hypothetical protein
VAVIESLQEKVPIGEPHREMGIGISESRGHEVLAIRNREVRNPDKKEEAPSWGQLSAYGESGFERSESRGQLHFGIAMSETPIGDKTAVTGIVVIWAKSLARRANA